MSPELYGAFVAATVALMLIPGPNVALIVANSVAHGPRWGLLTVAATWMAMALQLAVTALGLAGLLSALGQGFAILRWVGVAYLLWLGVRAWRAAPADLGGVGAQPKSARAVFLRGLLVSLTNPKTLFFYGAFFPQFVTAGSPPERLWLLIATFLILAAAIDSGWALLAGQLRGVLSRHGRLRNRISGAVFIAAGAGLAAARRGG